jgi:hypothetical protein
MRKIITVLTATFLTLSTAAAQAQGLPNWAPIRVAAYQDCLIREYRAGYPVDTIDVCNIPDNLVASAMAWIVIAPTRGMNEAHPFGLPQTVQRSAWTDAFCKPAVGGVSCTYHGVTLSWDN